MARDISELEGSHRTTELVGSDHHHVGIAVIGIIVGVG